MLDVAIASLRENDLSKKRFSVPGINGEVFEIDLQFNLFLRQPLISFD